MTTISLPQAIIGGPTQASSHEHEELTRIVERLIEVPHRDAPPLEVHREGCRIAVTWRHVEGLRPEISNHAHVHGDWQPVDEAVQIVAGICRVVLPGASFVRYVRLNRSRTRSADQLAKMKSKRVGRPVRRQKSIIRPPAIHSGRSDELELFPVLLVIAAVVCFLLPRWLGNS